MKLKDKKALTAYEKHVKLILESTNTGVNPFEGADAKKKRMAKAKKDYAFFVSHYFPHYATSKTPDFHVSFANRVKRNPIFKGFAQWGRASAKSVLVDITLIMWLHINEQCFYAVIIGNNEDRAQQLSDDLRAELEANQRLINDFAPDEGFITPGKWETGDYKTRTGLMVLALGMGQSVRGLRVGSVRPDYCVCDDLETKKTRKNPQTQNEVADWIAYDLIPTMDGPLRRFVYANNKPYPRMIQTVLQELHPNWHIDNIEACDASFNPAWNDKYTQDYFKSLYDEIGSLAFNAEYRNIASIQGSVFTQEMISWGKIPRLDHFDAIVGHWDIAYSGKNDYNAIPVWGVKDGHYYKIWQFCKQCKMKAAVEFIYDVEKRLPASVIIHWQYESQFWNDAVNDVIDLVAKEKNKYLNLSKVDTPRTKKLDRMMTMHPYYQNGRITYNDKEKGNNDFQTATAQLFGIEPGYRTHDDAPDADEQCISYLSRFASPARCKSSVRNFKRGKGRI